MSNSPFRHVTSSAMFYLHTVYIELNESYGLTGVRDYKTQIVEEVWRPSLTFFLPQTHLFRPYKEFLVLGHHSLQSNLVDNPTSTYCL